MSKISGIKIDEAALKKADEIITIQKIKSLCKNLTGKALVNLLAELYWSLDDYQKDLFLEATDNP